MRYLSWIITIPIAVAAVLFAVSNRQDVTLALWPLPNTLDLPVYLVTLAALVIGFIAGGFVAWIAAGRTRGRARRASDRAHLLEREVKELQIRAAAAEKRLKEMTRPVSGEPGRTTTILPVPAPGAAPPAPTVH